MWLEKYSGPWDKAAVSHFLSRTTYAKTRSHISELLSLDIDSAVDRLFDDFDPSNLPVHYRFENDPEAGLGETWVGKSYDSNVDRLRAERRRSLNAWVQGLITNGTVSIREKLMVFWHNHFAVTSLTVPEFGIDYIQILRRQAFGNFKELVEEITIDPGMLRFLNGDSNTKNSPNENYARELLELFTIGRGPLVAEGDYTNYTEDDVVAIARALTGWKKRIGEFGGESYFLAGQHDETDKQLSHRFDNAIITNAGEEEYKTVIDIILQKQEVARYICRQLHIWFIGAEISEEVEQNVIAPLAQQLYEDNYDLEPMLRRLFLSSYFMDAQHRGCIITSPVDLMSKVMVGLEVPMPSELIDKYYIWIKLHLVTRDLGQEMLNIPSVAGWKAYYQTPVFYKSWINSVFLIESEDMVKTIFNRFQTEGQGTAVDSLALIDQLEDPSNINNLIQELSELLFAVPISDGQKSLLRDVLIPGLPNFEWRVEYEHYRANLGDDAVVGSIRQKTDDLLQTMMKMAEFYIQ